MHEYLKHSNLGLEQRYQGDDGGGWGGVQFLISNFERLVLRNFCLENYFIEIQIQKYFS